MRILYFVNAFGLGTAKSGGTTRQIETMKRLAPRGVEMTTVGTLGAARLFGDERVPGEFFRTRASFGRTVERHSGDRILAYVLSTVHTLASLRRLPACDVVYSPSDAFCDTVPALAYKRLHDNRPRWIAMVHHRARPPGRRTGNALLNTLSFLGQRLSFALIRRAADQVLVYDTPEGAALGTRLRAPVHRSLPIPVENGIDIASIDRIPPQPARYAGCFAGGLRASKGIFDLVPVWARVCAVRPDATLAVAGGGSLRVTAQLRKAIRSAGLERNIVLLGALEPPALYAIMKQSRLFLSMSHEEGWGISVCEALACGLPVVAFDLPAFAFLGPHLERVRPTDTRAFAEAVLALLTDPERARQRTAAGRAFARRFDWQRVADREYEILAALLRDDTTTR